MGVDTTLCRLQDQTGAAPDTIMPQQWAERFVNPIRTPAQAIMIAMLELAYHDVLILGSPAAFKRKPARERSEIANVVDWIGGTGELARYRYQAFSLADVCEALGLPTEPIRAGLRRLLAPYPEPVARRARPRVRLFSLGIVDGRRPNARSRRRPLSQAR